MIHAWRMVNAGEGLIAELRETRRFPVFAFQHQRHESCLVSVAGENAGLSMYQAIYYNSISGPPLRDLTEELPDVERSGHPISSVYWTGVRLKPFQRNSLFIFEQCCTLTNSRKWPQFIQCAD
jgi:hypothetical protein